MPNLLRSRGFAVLLLLILLVAVGGLLAVLREEPLGRSSPAALAPPAAGSSALPRIQDTLPLEEPERPNRDAAARLEQDPAQVLGGQRRADLPPPSAAPKGSLRVEVVDRAGQPASDVPVAICFDRSDRPFNFIVQRSDERGEVVFRDVDARVQPRQPDEPGYAVALAIPLAQRELLPFDPLRLPDTALQLVVPPTGTLVVRLEEPQGELVSESALVALGPPGDPEANFRAYESRRAAGGFARFPQVALGESLRVRVVLSGRPPIALLVEGPTQEGAETLVTVQVQSSYPELVGRALGPEGEPLAANRGRVYLHYVRGGVRVLPFLTLADGRFTVRLFDSDGEAPERVDFEVVGDGSGTGYEAARVDVRLASSGPTDLGEVHFRARPLLAAGRVVDAGGQPLAGVSVRVEVAEDGSSFRTWPTVTSTTDGDGTFRLHGALPDGSVRLVARRRGFQTRSIDFTSPGAQGYEVILEVGEPERAHGNDPEDDDSQDGG